MTDQSYWGWAAKGLGGCVSILAMLAQEGSTPSAEHLQMLMEHFERLHRMIKKLSEELRRKGEA